MVSLSAPRSTGPLVLRLASSPRPALVQEPGAPGEHGAVDQRIELSGRVTVNWAAKTAGLLADEGLGPGDPVALDLPAHWLSHALALGVLCAGAKPADDGATPAAVLTDRPERWTDPATAVFAVALPRGLELPTGGTAADPSVVDVAAEILGQPDALPGPVDHVRPEALPAADVAAADGDARTDEDQDDDGPRPRLTWAGMRAVLQAWDAGRAVQVHP